MAKAVISNKIWLDKPPEGFDAIQKALTYKIIPDSGSSIKIRGRVISQVETIRNYSMVSPNIMAIPQGRLDLVPDHYEIVDKRTYNEVPFPLPKFPLNAEQVPVFEAVNDSCIINAKPGWGSL